MSVMALSNNTQLESSGEVALQTLTQQWYNSMVAGLNLSPQSFQIYQGNTVLPNLSSDLWAIFDSVPPLSVTHFAEPSQINRFSDDYGGIINVLIPSGGLEWKQAMGDQYPSWVTFLTSQTSLPTGGVFALFTTWAQLHIPNPAQAQEVITLYSQIQNGVVPTAQARFLGASGTYAYNKAIGDLRDLVKQAPSGGYSFDSATASSDITHTWAQGSVGSVFPFLPGDAVSFDSVNETFASSAVTVQATFAHVVDLTAGPLQVDTFVGDSTFKGWFSSEGLNLGFQNQGNDVWPVDNPVSWASSFGAQGNLQRFATSLVVADEMTMTMTSSASYSQADRVTIKEQSSEGCWPFYANVSSGISTSASFNDQGAMTVTITSPAGSPLILGANVLPIGQIFG